MGQFSCNLLTKCAFVHTPNAASADNGRDALDNEVSKGAPMKPVNTLSDAELASEFHSVARMAGRLRHDGQTGEAAILIRRQTAVLSEMTRRAERSYTV